MWQNPFSRNLIKEYDKVFSNFQAYVNIVPKIL